MNKVILLYIIALGIFAIPIYLFRSDIFSGMKEKSAYISLLFSMTHTEVKLKGGN